MVILSVDVHPILPPLLNVRSLLVVWSGELGIEIGGRKKKGRAWVRTAEVHTSTLCLLQSLFVAGARRANPEQKSRDSDLSYQTAGRMALAAELSAFGPDRRGDLLQQ